MLSENEAKALLTEETEKVEWKESLREDSLGEAVCAFANDLHSSGTESHLLFGVRNAGSLVGSTFGDQDSQRIANWLRTGKHVPPVIASIQIFHLTDGDVLVVSVQPSNFPPVRYSNRVYVRVGTTTQEANPQQEAILIERRRSLALSPDLLPIREATLDDLDLEFFTRIYLPAAVNPEVLVRNQRSTDHQLKALRMLSPDGIPTLAGILILGVDPRQFIPGAYIQFIRSEGTEITDPIQDQKEISGPLNEMLNTIDGLVSNNIRTATTILDTGREIKSPDYAKPALIQLLYNAIMHRTYTDSHSPVYFKWFSNRIEIQNPGGPFGQVTIENFGQGLTDYRNPTLAEAMKTLGWVQRFGYGIQEAKRALVANGNEEPVFDVQPAHVLVRIDALK
jgi:ATP-dependent DNA helicase RecG